MEEKHKVRLATEEERKLMCDCADIHTVYVYYICSCGLQCCFNCMERHVLKLHWGEHVKGS